MNVKNIKNKHEKIHENVVSIIKKQVSNDTVSVVQVLKSSVLQNLLRCFKKL